jgi:hypothetical protein
MLCDVIGFASRGAGNAVIVLRPLLCCVNSKSEIHSVFLRSFFIGTVLIL